MENNNQKKKHRCPFQAGTFIKKDLLLSKAFLSLTESGILFLILILLKRQMPGNKKLMQNMPKDTILNNGDITLSSPEYISIGLNASKLTRGMDDCIEKGFIRLIHQGGKCRGDYNKFELINDWRRYGAENFEVEKRDKSVGYGFCSKESHKKRKEKK